MTRILLCPACCKITVFQKVDSVIFEGKAWQCTQCLTSIETGQTTLSGAIPKR